MFKNCSSFAFICLLSLSLLLGGSTVAYASASFGAEFNFSSSKLQKASTSGFNVSDAAKKARDQMMNEVKKTCEACIIESKTNSHGLLVYHVSYSDGWFFDIAVDPSVVEVQTKPSDAESIQKNKDRIQKHIFDAAKSAGLLPAGQVMGQGWAGSHIHIGVTSALGKGPEAVLLLKNFMVDFSNHSELALGVFTNDNMNAPALALLPELERERFQKIAADVDSGAITTLEEFAQRVRKEVYDKTVETGVNPPSKFQAFNVNRIGNEDFDLASQTFELRAMRGQESADDFIILTRLLEARLQYIATKKSVQPTLLRVKKAEQMAEKFFDYVNETGLDFTPYEKFLTPRQRKLIPEIRARAYQKTCSKVFTN